MSNVYCLIFWYIFFNSLVDFLCFTPRLVFPRIGCHLIPRFDERYLLVLLGVVPMILGRVVMFPLPGQPLPYYDVGTAGLNSTNNANPPLGGFEGNCKYEWCKYIPAVHIAQFMTGFVIATVSEVFFSVNLKSFASAFALNRSAIHSVSP